MVDVSQEQARFITVSYTPLGQESRVHRVLIPWTNDYEKALELARSKLKRFFPTGTDNKFRWLASKAENERSWTELDAEVFPSIAQELENKAELRLCENHELEDVAVLPFGHDEDTYYQFKIIVIGPSGVGKTMLLQYFTKPESSRKDTLEATTKNRMDISSRFMTSDGTLLKAELWDTAGQERYRSLTQTTYRNANGVLLVYNLANGETFLECDDWRKDLEKNIDDLGQVQIVLVGNQVDLEKQREVSVEEAQKYADRHGFKFAEVSATKGTNVEQTFRTLMNAIFQELDARNGLEKFKRSKKQKLQNPNKQGSCGC